MRRSLAAVLLAALAVASVAAAATTQRRLVALRNVAETEANVLAESFDLRGIFGDLALAVLSADELTQLRTKYPTAYDVMPYDGDRLVVVFEKVELEKDTPASLEAWAHALRRAIQGDSNLRVLLSLPRKIVVLVHKGDIAALKKLSISADTEVLPMLSERMHTHKLSANENRLKHMRKTFRNARMADIPALVAQVNTTVLTDFVEYLSGENPASPILTRNAYSVGTGVTLAADWIASVYRSYGFSVTEEIFRDDMGPNVIAIYPGMSQPDTYVVIGAHYDSRATSSSSTTQRAPGANDDGSGTAALLQLAKIISDNQLHFEYSIILGSWCGEEQGLVGSRAYALKSRNEDLDIIAMLQADMIAFRESGEGYQCAFPDRNDDKDLTGLAIEVVNYYVPELETCYTTACCSDHQSFTEQGYSATQVFERCGPIADDQYHQSGDLLNRAGYDVDQLALNTQALLANLLVLAEAH